MDAFTLLDGLTNVRDRYLLETEERLFAERKTRRPVGAYLLAAALALLLCFGTALAVDGDFREKVFALFTVADTPPHEEERSGIVTDLGTGITAEYIFVPRFARIDGGMFLVCDDEVEMNQGSRYSAYVYENGQLVRQENHTFDEVYTVDGQWYHLQFQWAAYEDNVACTWTPSIGDQSDEEQGEWRVCGGTVAQYRVELDGAYFDLDLTTGDLTPAEVQPDYWQSYTPQGEQLVSGRRLTLERQADGTFTLTDMATGQSTPLEGYALPESATKNDIFGAENPHGTALLIGVRGGESWNYTTLDVVTPDKCVRIRHHSADDVQEHYMTWLSDSRFVIDCTPAGDTGEGTWFYFYETETA